ncbi:hypothetical protein C8Q76DRAFT_271554 [Earliella scabrosa]|nr:hypothetical protein C8Q76DRAFT_271554 [Earliella scabrosa]
MHWAGRLQVTNFLDMRGWSANCVHYPLRHTLASGILLTKSLDIYCQTTVLGPAGPISLPLLGVIIPSRNRKYCNAESVPDLASEQFPSVASLSELFHIAFPHSVICRPCDIECP